VTVNGEPVTVEVEAGEIRVEGELMRAALTRVPGTPVWQLELGTEVHRLVVVPGADRGHYRLCTDGHRLDVEALDERTRAIRELTAKHGGAPGPAPLVAPMPGLVVRINVTVGDTVHPGQGLVVMEAMEMENELRASSAGTVTAVRVVEGSAVEKGAVLVEME
jgi:pyruvate carboxylase subunit B